MSQSKLTVDELFDELRSLRSEGKLLPVIFRTATGQELTFSNFTVQRDPAQYPTAFVIEVEDGSPSAGSCPVCERTDWETLDSDT